MKVVDITIEHIIIVSYIILVLITGYYAWTTKKILEEQKRLVLAQNKAAELTVAPDIGFQFESNSSKGIRVYVNTRTTSLFDLTAKAFVNGDLRHEQYLGNALILPHKSSQNTQPLYLESLRQLEREKEFMLCIEIDYEAKSGSRIVQQYSWKASINSKDNLEIKGNYPEKMEYISAPWLDV